MKEEFSELIKLIQLREIKIINSHETVLQYINALKEDTQIQIQTEQGYNKDDPVINDKLISFRPRYIFTFSVDGRPYFRAEYVLLISFEATDVERFKTLYAISEVKDVFLKKQLHRTLWSILRGTVLDAFNRHSLQPVPLPWVI
jgi:hypothetical protein